MILSSDDPKIAEIEDNILAYYKSLSLALDGTFTVSGNIIWFTTGRAYFPRFNGVLRTVVPPGQELEDVIAPVLGHFLANRLPFFWADYPPGSTPGISDYLHSKGISCLVFRMPAMGRSLHKLPSFQAPSDMEIHEVHSQQDQDDWLAVLMEGFQEPEPTRLDFRQYLQRSVADSQLLFRHYLARWQGAPCATASLLLAPQAAGIYHVTVLPAYRGRGLGKAATLAGMQVARELGYTRSLLFATQDGYPLYQKLGFETIAEADLYVWRGPG